MSGTLVPLEQARWRLALLWFVGAAGLFVVLLVQSMTNVYRGRLEDVWGWMSTVVLPTLALMITVFSAGAVVERKEGKQDGEKPPELVVRRGFYLLAWWLSLTYLLVILLTVFATPVIVYFHTDETLTTAQIISGAAPPAQESFAAADALLISHRWLGVLQSLVVASLGALFFTQQPK